MKNNYRKIVALLCMLSVVCTMIGCSEGVDVELETRQETESVSTQEIVVESETTEENISQEEIEIQDKIVDYGDCITISCDITKQSIVWEGAGEAVFEVASTSEQFKNEFDLSEEVTLKKVEKVIGKTAGESFTLWMEGGDGLYGYEYTIQQILDKPADKVSYGDKIHTTFSMKAIGVDRGDDIKSGELAFRVNDTDKVLAGEEIGYSVSAAERRLPNIVGKSVGDTFRINQEAPEWSGSYLCTIQQIEKTVEYGDTIKATVRRACISAEDAEELPSQEKVELKLLAPKGMLQLAGNDLNMADTMKLLKEIQGKSIGDKVWFSIMTDSQRINFDITVTDISAGEVFGGELELETLMLSTQENSRYFLDDNEDAPIYYAVVADEESNKVFEYVRGSEGDYYLEKSYSYEPEYDEQERVKKETYSGGIEMICEYRYSDRGICVERKTTYPYSESVYFEYCDDAGMLIGSKAIYKDGSEYVIEYADGVPAKGSSYDEEGKETIYKYDEWGFLIEPEVYE